MSIAGKQFSACSASGSPSAHENSRNCYFVRFNGKLHLELHVRQAVVEFEERCIHLDCAWPTRMNETLISHPPGGGGFGTVGHNGGPACAEPIATKQTIVTNRKGTLIIRTTSIFLDRLWSIIRRGRRESPLVANYDVGQQQTMYLARGKKGRCEHRPPYRS